MACEKFAKCVSNSMYMGLEVKEEGWYILKKFQCSLCARKWEERYRYVATYDSRTGDLLKEAK